MRENARTKAEEVCLAPGSQGGAINPGELHLKASLILTAPLPSAGVARAGRLW